MDIIAEDEEMPYPYLVKIGSGMGLIHSGDLSDAGFRWKAEGPWASRQWVADKHGLIGYVRFKDDVLACWFCSLDPTALQEQNLEHKSVKN